MRIGLLTMNSPESLPAVPVARLNIPEIAWSLKQTQLHFKSINKSLNVRRGKLTGEAVDNMIEGYRFVDTLLAEGADPLAMGNSALLLEINTLVLCGSDSANRHSFSRHIEKNREYFYDNQQGGVGSLMEWRDFHAHDNIWKKAAGLYIHITSQPQLFFEGNHRSAILIMSFLLAREGYPPFVLTADNAKELLDHSRQISELKKNSVRMLIQVPRLRSQLAETLKRSLDRRHLLAP